MSYISLSHFIQHLEEKGQLIRLDTYVSPELEMAEFSDRLSKSNGSAVLFANNGTQFPVLMNAFGSNERMLAALGLKSYGEFEQRLNAFFSMLSSPPSGISGKFNMLKKARELKHAAPVHSSKKGKCFEIQMSEPDLDKLPVIKCWPYDGGRFFTLPMVHTTDPETGMVNVGMYRMQVFDKNTTGMHWHRHKGGAAHYEKYKKLKKRMPVVVTLGGDPVYTYCSTAPLPDMISEYAFAGFLRKRSVRLVKCLSCDIEVPEDADIVIEGYIDPEEELRMEGPFGDHTGFYSLPDKYPVFHVTHISHRKNAVFPATVVGIPPMEDAYLGEATGRLFLPLIKKLIAPEIVDMHLPVEGGFHNLAVVSIRKSYPGQAVKVMNALWGAGQMMFVKNIIVVDENVNVRNPEKVGEAVMHRCRFPSDVHFMNGPLDVLDHANTSPCFGKKMGLDATGEGRFINGLCFFYSEIKGIVKSEIRFAKSGTILPVLFIDKQKASSVGDIHKQIVQKGTNIPFIVYIDHSCLHMNYSGILWMFLANYDPDRDLYVEKSDVGFVCGFDGTLKTIEKDGLAASRPNILVMDDDTMKRVDELWKQLFPEKFVESPSLVYKKITLNKGYLFDKQNNI